jgi:membrane associated rhomboid family serine protease
MLSVSPNIVPAAVYSTRAMARERSAVLLAKSITHWVAETDDGFALFVEGRHLDEARAQLAAYDAEQSEAARCREPPPAPLRPAGWPGIIIAVVMLAGLYAWQHADGSTLGDRWCRDSVAIFRDGEWWRAATALLLHEDPGHLAGNIFFGVMFGLFVARAFGAWTGWSMVMASGMLGNLVTAAVWYPDPYRGIGASTAVFGAVGILVGHGLHAASKHHGLRHHRAWLLPLGGGLALLGLFGSGTEHSMTDLAAHLFGFVCGLPFGFVASLWQQRSHRPAAVPAA